MFSCNRCGAELHIKESYCSACGLHKIGGKGKIFKNANLVEITSGKLISKELCIIKDVKDHKVWNYYDSRTFTNKKLNSEAGKLNKRINEIEKIIISCLNPSEDLFFELHVLEDHLESIIDYQVLMNINAVKEKISKYYDLEKLTQEKIDAELTRLHNEIQSWENAIVYMKNDPQEHPNF